MSAQNPYVKILDIEQTLAELQETVDLLRQERNDLEIALTTAIEHGDAIESQLEMANRQLKAEVHERLTVERQLRDLVATITQKSRDLEVVLQTITEHADQIDLQWLKRYIESENDARRDALTGLANRRMLDETISREWKRARREQQPLCLVLCDVDHFKDYNDHYGHVAGDQCLQWLSSVLQGVLRREGDLAARYGGEEFVLVLPNTDLDGGRKVAEQILFELSRQPQHHHSSPFGMLTVSIGLAACTPETDQAAHSLLAEADRLLYLAKQRGRNCIAE